MLSTSELVERVNGDDTEPIGIEPVKSTDLTIDS